MVTQSSQVSQLLQAEDVSSTAISTCIGQSAGMATWLDALALTTVMAAISTATMLPAHPRKGRRISIRVIKRQRFKRDICQ